MKQLNPNHTLTINEYSFHQFLQDFQEAVLEGYVLDLTSNEFFPQKYGDYLTVTLVPTQWFIDEEEEQKIKEAIESGTISRDNFSASQLEAAYQANEVVYDDEDVRNHLVDAELVNSPYSNVDEPSSQDISTTTTFSPEVVTEVKKAGRPKKT